MAKSEDAVLLIGLGRFGSAVGEALTRLGHEVLAVDKNGTLVQEWSSHLTHVIQADATNIDAMRQLGAEDFKKVVVAIGADVEASLLSTLVLLDLHLPEIWAKAITPQHGRILERVGAKHVIYPETQVGERVAHMLTAKMIDFIEFDDGYAIAKVKAPAEAFARTLGDVKLRTKYGVTVVGVKRPGHDFVHALPDTMVDVGDLLIVSGRTDLVEKFSAHT